MPVQPSSTATRLQEPQVALATTREPGWLRRLVPSTADAVLALRIAGAVEPDENVRHPDYMAVKFFRPSPLAPVAVRLGLRGAFVRLAEHIGPGAYFYELARGRHIDQAVARALRRQLQQLVILGAGFDTTAYRYREALRETAVFEIDHPATASEKLHRLRAVFGRLPDHVAYLQADFNHDDLTPLVASVGYSPTRRTMFIWSGVSYFLEPDGVANVLRLAGRAQPDSLLVFDYCYDCVLNGKSTLYGSRETLMRAARLGEPYRFAIGEGQAASLIADYGISLTSDLGPKDLTARYLTRTDGTTHGTPYGFLAIADATVE
jgi:methyltransferase (TIGR00027 family)